MLLLGNAMDRVCYTVFLIRSPNFARQNQYITSRVSAFALLAAVCVARPSDVGTRRASIKKAFVWLCCGTLCLARVCDL